MRFEPDDFDTTGRVWLRGVLSVDDLAVLDGTFSDANKAGQRLVPSSEVSKVLGRHGPIASALEPIMSGAFPTRAVSFNKSSDQNWGVPWHQDRVIAVAEKQDTPDFRNWSQKAGVWHCEPPGAVLERMLFLRIHLDDDTNDNGAMEIAKGSHVRGRITMEDAGRVAADYETETCQGARGDVLVLKMLTLHRSSAATAASARRVLRVDYANSVLPVPLRWHAETL